MTISAGIAFYPEHANDLHSLQKQADMALYQSKYNGRARVTVYVPGDRADASLERGGVGLEYLMADNRLLTTHRLVTLVDAVSAAAAMEQGPLSPTAFSEVLDRWSSSNSLHSQAVAALDRRARPTARRRGRGARARPPRGAAARRRQDRAARRAS